MAESSSEVDNKPGFFKSALSRFSLKGGERVIKKTERELQLEAFESYQESLSKSQDSGVKSIARGLEDKINRLAGKFSEAKKENSGLSSEQFLNEENKGRSHVTIEGAGCNPNDSLMNNWAKKPQSEGWGVLSARGISDLLGERDYVDVDKRFKRSDASSTLPESVVHTVRSSFGGIVNENSHFSQCWTPVTNSDFSKTNIFVGLKREDRQPSASYFTANEGGIRGLAIQVSVPTLATAVEKQASSL